MVLDLLRRHPVAATVLLAGAAVGAARLVDSRIDPVEWQPPDPPELTGPLAPNGELAGAATVVTCEGPEDVAFDDDGRLYTGTEGNHVVRTVEPVAADTTNADLERVATLDGRPLGMTFDGEDLLVCATDAGLQSVSPDGAVTTLSERADGRPIAFADDLHVADDGTVYFTDATAHEIFQDELFELRDTGRLLAYDPDADETDVVLGDLGFANGVCPHADGESLLVTETSRYRVTRCWVDGDREGDSERFATNLPGYPDNVEAAEDGTHWLAVPTPRDETLDGLHGRPWLKRQLGKLPTAAIQQIEGDPYGLVLRLDADGEVVESLHDPDAVVYGVTSATPHDGALYLGSLFGERVTRYDLA
jgi:sugar lactone lactonase YvrE